jgi:cardiolipin synthase
MLEELIASAREEIHIAAYLIAGSFVRLLNLLEAALERGVKVHLLLNRHDDHPPELRERLSSLKKRFAHVRITDFQDSEGSQLHAKALVIDRKKAVIGSANFSRGGMVVNHELAVLFEGDQAWYLAKLIDDLAHQTDRHP